MKKIVLLFCMTLTLLADDGKYLLLKSFPYHLNVSADMKGNDFVHAAGLFIKNCSCPEGNSIREKYELERDSYIEHLTKRVLTVEYPELVKFIQDEFKKDLSVLEKKFLQHTSLQIAARKGKAREIPSYKCLWHAMLLAERGSVTAQIALLYKKDSCFSSSQREAVAQELFRAGYTEAYVALGTYYKFCGNKKKAAEYLAMTGLIKKLPKPISYIDIDGYDFLKNNDIYVFDDFPFSQKIFDSSFDEFKQAVVQDKDLRNKLLFFISNCSCKENKKLIDSIDAVLDGNADKEVLIQKLWEAAEVVRGEYKRPLTGMKWKIMTKTCLEGNPLKPEIPFYQCKWHAVVLAERGLVQAQLALLYQTDFMITAKNRVNMATELFEAGYLDAFIAMGAVCRRKAADRKAALSYFKDVLTKDRNNAVAASEFLETLKAMGDLDESSKTYAALCRNAADKNYYLAVRVFALFFAKDEQTKEQYLIRAAKIAKDKCRANSSTQVVQWESELKKLKMELDSLHRAAQNFQRSYPAKTRSSGGGNNYRDRGLHKLSIFDKRRKIR